MKCTNCKYCYLQDAGYSNYTVEGTEFYCLKKQHPSDGFDVWFGKDERLEHAGECKSFSAGEVLMIDVDMIDGDISNYTDDPEIIELYKVV